MILDETGAERLLSHGDMLFLEPGNLKPLRYHGPFVREKDVIELNNYWKSKGEVFYEQSLIQNFKKSRQHADQSPEGLDIKEDPMYDEILEYVKSCKVVSASFLQRRFSYWLPSCCPYNRNPV